MLVARLSRRVATLAAVSALALPAVAGAQATWDDLPNGNFANTPLGYANHNWFYGDGTFGLGSVLQYSTLNADCRSTPNCAYNANGNTQIRVEALSVAPGDAFTFQGFLRGGYPGSSAGPGNALVQGFIGGSATAAFSAVLAVSDNAWTAANFTSMNVNKILITPSDAAGRTVGGYLRLDDVTFGRAAAPGPITTPEPATFVLVGAGLAGLAAVRRRRA